MLEIQCLLGDFITFVYLYNLYWFLFIGQMVFVGTSLFPAKASHFERPAEDSSPTFESIRPAEHLVLWVFFMICLPISGFQVCHVHSRRTKS